MNKTEKRSKATKTKSQNKPTAAIDVRLALLEAGKHLFAQKGLSGTSIRDIASAAKVNSSMISYYFDGKEGLYKQCIEDIGAKRLGFFEQILTPANSQEELRVKMTLFLDNLFTLIYDDRDTGLMIIREYDRLNSPAGETFTKSFLRLFELLKEFFTHAQKKKLISKKIDALTLSFLFFGTITSQLRLDHFKEKTFQRSLFTKKERDHVFNSIVHLFLLA